MKKAPPQKSAPPPSLPKEGQADKKPIVEQKAKEVIIDEKVRNILFSNAHNTRLGNKNIWKIILAMYL